MLVIEHTGYGRGGRYRIASYTIPRATGRPVFFMQHGGGHKCHGRVPGRERMIVRTIRTGDICRMFHRIDGCSHDTGGDGFGYEHSGPRASSLYTAYF